MKKDRNFSIRPSLLLPLFSAILISSFYSGQYYAYKLSKENRQLKSTIKNHHCEINIYDTANTNFYQGSHSVNSKYWNGTPTIFTNKNNDTLISTRRRTVNLSREVVDTQYLTPIPANLEESPVNECTLDFSFTMECKLDRPVNLFDPTYLYPRTDFNYHIDSLNYLDFPDLEKLYHFIDTAFDINWRLRGEKMAKTPIWQVRSKKIERIFYSNSSLKVAFSFSLNMINRDEDTYFNIRDYLCHHTLEIYPESPIRVMNFSVIHIQKDKQPIYAATTAKITNYDLGYMNSVYCSDSIYDNIDDVFKRSSYNENGVEIEFLRKQ